LCTAHRPEILADRDSTLHPLLQRIGGSASITFIHESICQLDPPQAGGRLTSA
jgi:hypothetical protein